MITDPVALQEAKNAWEYVRATRNVIVGNCNAASFFSWGFNQSRMRGICFNLLLASAFSVLEEALGQLRFEGVFASPRDNLATLMVHSRVVLPWLDYPLINAARLGRNQSIHSRNYLSHAQCRVYLAAIERELHAWGILAETTPNHWHW